MISCHVVISRALRNCSASVWRPLTSTSLKKILKRMQVWILQKQGSVCNKCHKAYLGWQDPIRGVQGLAAPALQLLHQAALGVASSRPDAGQHVHKLLICLSECITSSQIAQTSQLKYLPSLIVRADTDTALSGINDDTASASAVIAVPDSVRITTIEGFDSDISALNHDNFTQSHFQYLLVF